MKKFKRYRTMESQSFNSGKLHNDIFLFSFFTSKNNCIAFNGFKSYGKRMNNLMYEFILKNRFMVDFLIMFFYYLLLKI